MNSTPPFSTQNSSKAFRQLQRLSEALLVQKHPKGTYGITEYGKLMLQLSSSMEFNEKLLKGVKFKDLFPESELVALKILSEKQINVEGRGLPLSDIPAMIMLTEKEGAICLRFIGGRMD